MTFVSDDALQFKNTGSMIQPKLRHLCDFLWSTEKTIIKNCHTSSDSDDKIFKIGNAEFQFNEDLTLNRDDSKKHTKHQNKQSDTNVDISKDMEM